MAVGRRSAGWLNTLLNICYISFALTHLKYVNHELRALKMWLSFTVQTTNCLIINYFVGRILRRLRGCDKPLGTNSLYHLLTTQ